MKKFSAILLVLCMIMSMVTAVPTFAEDAVAALTIQAESSELIKSFYDNSGAEDAAIEVEGDYARIRQGGEWISYDISSLEEGTYSVSVTWKNAYEKTKYDAGLDFIIDGELELRNYTAAASTTVEENKLIGSIFVPEGAKELKIKNHGFAAIDLDAFTLTFAGAEDTSSKIKIYAQNATSVNDASSTYTTFALGTDYYDYRCNAKSNTYTEECDKTCADYVDGEGYHYPFKSSSVTDGNNATLQKTSWIRYDISDLKAGYYDLTLNVSARKGTDVSFYIDSLDNCVVSDFALVGSSYSAFDPAYDAEVGVIYIPENATYMYLCNSSSRAIKPIYFELERLNMVKIDKDTECISFNAHDEALTAPKTDGDFVVYEPSGEWVSYDISSFKAGTYKVVVDYVSEVSESRNFRGLDFVVDGNLELRSYLGQKETPSGSEVGKIYLPEGTTELKIKNHGFYQIKVKSFLFEHISDEDTSEDITISAHNATSSYVDGATEIVLLEDYYDSGCSTSSVATSTSQATTAHKSDGSTCYHYPFTHSAVASGSYVQHNAGEWTRYDISDLKPGTYQVSANIWVTERTGFGPVVAELRLGDINSDVVASSVITPVYEEEEELAEDETAEPTVTKTYLWSDATIGIINVTEDDEYLIIKSQNGGDYYKLNTLTFTEYFPDVTEVTYSSDAAGENLIEGIDKLDTAYVTVNLVRPKKLETIGETIVVALYDGARLESIQPTSVTDGYEFSKTYEVSGLDALAEPEIKVFVWDSLTGMVPVIKNDSISISHTSQYLGDGFTRLNLNNTSFKAETERTFDVEIKEDGEYAIFFSQPTKLANSFGVSLEKDGEEVVVAEMAEAADDSYAAVYNRVGAINKGESGSVSLTSGIWKLKFKALNDADISYIDVRSTIISVPNEEIAIYLGDYNLYEYIGGPTYVNANISYDESDYPRGPGFKYFADYKNDELAQQNLSARGIILTGTSKAHTYKLDIEQADTYKITAIARTTTAAAVVSSTAATTLTMSLADGAETSYTHTYEVGAAKNSSSPKIKLELITELDEGSNELTFTLDRHRAMFYRLVIEPYEEEIITATENGAEFTLTKPEVVQFVTDARRLYVTPAYADYTTSISQNYGMDGIIARSDHPMPAALVWDELSGAESYTLYVSENEDLEDAKVFSGITETSYDVYNLLTGHKYYWKVVGDNGAETDVYYFTTNDTVRFIYAPNGANIRDLGGWNGLNLGMAYRGAQPDGYDTRYGVCLTEAGIDTFLNDLKIKTDLDLRGDMESNILEINQIFAAISAYTGAYSGAEKYATAIRAFADVDNYPVYFHCAGGADRTGTVAYIIEAIAGAKEEDMAIDFELTAASQFSYRFRHREEFVKFLNTLKAYDGETLQEKAENYALETLGLTRAEVSNIQSLMAGNKVTFSEVSDLAVGENTIALKNYNGQALSGVIFNGAALDAELDADGELTVTFAEAGTGEIVFADGSALKFVVA